MQLYCCEKSCFSMSLNIRLPYLCPLRQLVQILAFIDLIEGSLKLPSFQIPCSVIHQVSYVEDSAVITQDTLQLRQLHRRSCRTQQLRGLDRYILQFRYKSTFQSEGGGFLEISEHLTSFYNLNLLIHASQYQAIFSTSQNDLLFIRFP